MNAHRSRRGLAASGQRTWTIVALPTGWGRLRGARQMVELGPRVRVAGEPSLYAFAANRVRILRGDGWRGQEKAWFAFLFAQDLTQRVAARPAEAPGLVRALAGGLRGSAR